MNKKLFSLIFASLLLVWVLSFSLVSASENFNINSAGGSRLFVNGASGNVGIGGFLR